MLLFHTQKFKSQQLKCLFILQKFTTWIVRSHGRVVQGSPFIILKLQAHSVGCRFESCRCSQLFSSTQRGVEKKSCAHSAGFKPTTFSMTLQGETINRQALDHSAIASFTFYVLQFTKTTQMLWLVFFMWKRIINATCILLP